MRYTRLIAGLGVIACTTGMFGFNPKEGGLSQLVSGTAAQSGKIIPQPTLVSRYINNFTLYNLADSLVRQYYNFSYFKISLSL